MQNYLDSPQNSQIESRIREELYAFNEDYVEQATPHQDLDNVNSRNMINSIPNVAEVLEFNSITPNIIHFNNFQS